MTELGLDGSACARSHARGLQGAGRGYVRDARAASSQRVKLLSAAGNVWAMSVGVTRFWNFSFEAAYHLASEILLTSYISDLKVFGGRACRIYKHARSRENIVLKKHLNPPGSLTI